MSMPSIPHLLRVGSGAVIVVVLLITTLILLCMGHLVGWDATWRSFGVTPLQPHFFDMHVVTEHAACALNGFDAYVATACDPTTKFDLPPIWLSLGPFGINGDDSGWLAVAIAAAALAVMVALLKGRSTGHGLLAAAAVLSPSVMMGVERGNVDLSLLALVGGAALILEEQRNNRIFSAAALAGAAIVLKLYPVFCIAIAARLCRRTLLFSIAIATVTLVYLALISRYIPFIRLNAPTTFILSYGYKVPFLGLDHLRSEAGLGPIGLADTWLPISLVALTLILAASTAMFAFREARPICGVAGNAAGASFCFGAGIYCGTFLLGSNFIYRLMFLLLCLPQLQDWSAPAHASNRLTAMIARGILILILSALWLNGSANGHSTFMLVPQLLDWLIFLVLATTLFFNFLDSATSARNHPSAMLTS